MIFSLALMLAITLIYAFVGRHFIDPKSVYILPLFVGYMWIPGVIALIAAKKEKISLKIYPNGLREGHFITYFSAFFFSFLVFTFSLLFVPIDSKNLVLMLDAFRIPTAFRPWFSILFMMIKPLLAAFTVGFATALGEELMWRGYLLEKLRKIGFWRASLFIGVLWGMWHAPIIALFGHNYPHPVWGSLMMILLCVSVTPIMNYFTLKYRGVAIPTIFHATINTMGGMIFFFTPKVNPYLLGSTGIITVLCLGLVNLWLMRKVKQSAKIA